jgi:heme exporter protein A
MRLRAWDLTLERGGRRLFEALSFTVEAGAALVVTGANGAGKSSLLRALLGFLPLQAGGFALDGGDAQRTLGEQAHYLGHADALKSALTAGENLVFWAGALGGAASRETAITALERVGLAHVVDFPVRALSAGQKRRVAIARLLVAARPVWLLDEPTSALDAGAQRALAVILEAHLRGGGVIAAATHADLGLRSARELRLGARAELAA